jgi:protein SCO1
VLVFVYYRCPGICSPLLQDVAELISATDLEPGNDFTVLTISFDPTDTPETAKRKKENYWGLLTRPVRDDAWRFLTGDAESLQRLTEATGFRYMPDGREFRHARALFFIAKDGKLVRQLGGKNFLPFDLKMAVAEAEKGEVGNPLRRVLLLCFSYDPEGKRYVANVTRIAGVITVLFVATVFFILIRKRKRPAEEVQNR